MGLYRRAAHAGAILKRSWPVLLWVDALFLCNGSADWRAIRARVRLLAKMTADNLTLANLINALDTRLQAAETTLSSHLAD